MRSSNELFRISKIRNGEVDIDAVGSNGVRRVALKGRRKPVVFKREITERHIATAILYADIGDHVPVKRERRITIF